MIALKSDELLATCRRELVGRLFGDTCAPWLAGALILRLVLMPITWHNDTVWMPWMAYKIVEGHWNVYQYLLDTYGEITLKPSVWVTNMPLFYVLTAGWTGLLKLLGLVDVGQWSFDATRWYIPHFNRGIFFAKLMYVPFDLLIGWALGRLVPPDRRGIVWVAWFLSPITLVCVYMMGQNDIISAAFVVLATVAGTSALEGVQEQSPHSGRLGGVAAILLGLGAAFKWYPLLLVLPFALVLERRLDRIIRLCVLGVIPFILAIAPFVSSRAFQQGVLLNPEADRIFATLPELGRSGVSPFFAAYCLILVFLAYSRLEPGWGAVPLPTAVFLVLAALFAFTNWNFYWLVWLSPFIALGVATVPITQVNAAGYVLVFLAWTWNWGTAASSHFLSAVFSWAAAVPAVSETVGRYYPWDRVVVVVQSIFVGLLVGHVIVLIRWRSMRPLLEGPRLRPALVAVPYLAMLAGWIVLSFLPLLVHR